MLITDPLDLALDADGDLDIVDGDLRLVSGVEGVTQLVRIALQMFRGEWFLDLDAGMPYWQTILGKRYNEATLRDAVREAILGVDAVVSITKLEIAWDGTTRTVTITWRALTEYGDTDTDTLEV